MRARIGFLALARWQGLHSSDPQGLHVFKFLSPEPLHNPLSQPTPTADTEVKCTTCYMCACRCGIRVHLREGDKRAPRCVTSTATRSTHSTRA